MSGKRTIKEIVEYLRECPTNTIADRLVKLVADHLADKLEDAVRLEESKHREEVKSLQATIKKLNDALTEQNGKFGNAAAMREALKNLTRFEESDIRQLETLAQRAIDNDIYGGGILQAITYAIREGKEALSKPPRNCDEGTAEEQYKRFIDYCCSKCDGSNCKHGVNIEDEIYKCAIQWEQMPYEPKEGTGE